MSLFAITLSAAVLLLVVGVALLWSGQPVERAAKAFPRSTVAAVVFFGTGALWFLRLLSQLGPADFGDYRNILVVVFAAVGLGAFFVSKDFLAVRGVAVLTLLYARQALDASMVYTPPPASRVWLNGVIYVAIILAIWLGAAPFYARDIIGWFYARRGRAQVLGAVCFAYGIGLAVLASNYHNLP